MAERIVLVKVHHRPVNGVPCYNNRVPDYYDRHGREYYSASSGGELICVKCDKIIHEGHECFLRGWYEEIVHCADCVIITDIMDVVDAYEEVRDSEDEEGAGV